MSFTEIIIYAHGTDRLTWRGRRGRIRREYYRAGWPVEVDYFASLAEYLATEWPGMEPVSRLESWRGRALLIDADDLQTLHKRLRADLGFEPKSLEALLE